MFVFQLIFLRVSNRFQVDLKKRKGKFSMKIRLNKEHKNRIEFDIEEKDLLTTESFELLNVILFLLKFRYELKQNHLRIIFQLLKKFSIFKFFGFFHQSTNEFKVHRLSYSTQKHCVWLWSIKMPIDWIELRFDIDNNRNLLRKYPKFQNDFHQ